MQVIMSQYFEISYFAEVTFYIYQRVLYFHFLLLNTSTQHPFFKILLLHCSHIFSHKGIFCAYMHCFSFLFIFYTLSDTKAKMIRTK